MFCYFFLKLIFLKPERFFADNITSEMDFFIIMNTHCDLDKQKAEDEIREHLYNKFGKSNINSILVVLTTKTDKAESCISHIRKCPVLDKNGFEHYYKELKSNFESIIFSKLDKFLLSCTCYASPTHSYLLYKKKNGDISVKTTDLISEIDITTPNKVDDLFEYKTKYFLTRMNNIGSWKIKIKQQEGPTSVKLKMNGILTDSVKELIKNEIGHFFNDKKIKFLF
jgi:hypothetical protein